MIQLVEAAMLRMQIARTKVPIAPASCTTRSSHCTHLVHLIVPLVLALIGFASVLPYGTTR